MKGELGGKIMTKFVPVRPKTFSYIMDDIGTHVIKKKAKATKKCVIKKILRINNYKDCLLNNEIILKSQQRFKSEAHNMYTEEINKIALSSNDDKAYLDFDCIHTHPLGINAFIVCKSELDHYLKHKKMKSYYNHNKDLKVKLISSNDYKRLQTFYKITSYPYGTSAGKVCKTNILSKVNIKRLILIIILMKIKANIFQNDHIFRIIYTEYLL